MGLVSLASVSQSHTAHMSACCRALFAVLLLPRPRVLCSGCQGPSSLYVSLHTIQTLQAPCWASLLIRRFNFAYLKLTALLANYSAACGNFLFVAFCLLIACYVYVLPFISFLPARCSISRLFFFSICFPFALFLCCLPHSNHSFPISLWILGVVHPRCELLRRSSAAQRLARGTALRGGLANGQLSHGCC